MFHGFATATYTDQGGKRGDEDFFSTNMFMFMAQRRLGPGTFGFRNMLSLEPLMGEEGYPLLLQTGETADGITPLIDRQHPHDLFMELALTYSIPMTDESSVFAYFGLPGEPALGPPAFMHRFSGIDIPEAPISHHWLDSTHITYGVGTLGTTWKNFKLETSIFTGQEPDEDRWDIESPHFDSYSLRLSHNPTKDWAFQVSYGWINHPEQIHSEIDTDRLTFSTIYNKSWKNNNWQTTFAWGRNMNDPGHNLDAFLIETTLRLQDTHSILGRFEYAEKDELFPEGDPLEGTVFDVNKLSTGYIYDFPEWHHIQLGLGVLGSIHFLPSDLDFAYGDIPLSFTIFGRIKLI
jgi:hypothetical protein